MCYPYREIYLMLSVSNVKKTINTSCVCFPVNRDLQFCIPVQTHQSEHDGQMLHRVIIVQFHPVLCYILPL